PWPETDERLARWALISLVAAAAVVVQLALTRAVWGAHHVLVLWPFPHLAAALSLVLAYRRLARDPPWRRALVTVAAAAMAVIVAGQVRAALRYERDVYAASRTPNPLFTPAIYELSRWVNPRLPKVASVITADWGLRYPLRTLAPAGERQKVRDFWLVFREHDRGEGRYLYKEWFEGRRVIAVSYQPHRHVFAESDRNWRRFLEKHLQPRGGLSRVQLGSYEIVCVAPDGSAAELCGAPAAP
ncbi:MAG TPA: hypothetical protein VFO85_02005, partial [Vicinamibacteria bacterium]|nr:hypothetical protein [Vicinamibacteria bacterium]